MAKEIHALKDKTGQIFWPATATDAVIHPKTRLPLTSHIEEYNLSSDNTITTLELGIAKLVALGINQTPGTKLLFLNTSGLLEEWIYYDPNEPFSNPSGWRKGGEVDATLDATSENPVQNKVITQVIEENEEIIAASLVDLDERILQNKSDINELRENTSASLSDLGEKVLQNKSDIDELEETTSSSFSDLSERILQNRSDIDELEEVTSVSLNSLNERLEDLEDDVREVEEIVDKGHLQKIGWAQLKDLRDNAQLVPGYFYRITDYQCTTAQENTRSAGHQFDIVLLALSENKLAEEGWAMMHDNIYDVTFSDGVTKKCYIYENGNIYVVDIDTLLGTEDDISAIVIDESNKTATYDGPSSALSDENVQYNYFQTSNLSAWKVWYCLDNDTTRFAWADDRVAPEYTTSEDILGGEILEFQGYTTYSNNNVTYRRYGTKEQLSRYYGDQDPNNIGWVLCSNVNTDTDISYYTKDELEEAFSSEVLSLVAIYYDHDTSVAFDASNVCTSHSSVYVQKGRGVIYRMIDEWGNDVPYDFKNIQFKRCEISTGNQYYMGIKDGGMSNKYNYNSSNIDYYYTFSYRSSTSQPILDSSIYANTEYTSEQSGINATNGTGNFGIPNQTFRRNSSQCDKVCDNIVGELFFDWVGNGTSILKKQFLNNITFFGQCWNNSIGRCCYNFSLYESNYNYINSRCFGLLLLNSSKNSIGQECHASVIRGSNQTIGSHCGEIKLYSGSYNNYFGEYCYSITFNGYCTGNTFGKGCSCITLYTDTNDNTFGKKCSDIVLQSNISYNIFGDGCRYISFNGKSFYRYITVEPGNQYITLNCTSTTSSSQYYQNVTIAKGTNTTTTTKTISDPNVNQNYQTIYKPANCQEISV